MTIRALSVLLPLLVTATAGAQSESPARVPRPPLGELFEAWKAEHGPNWRPFVALDTGHIEMIAGGRAEPRWSPREDGDFEALAREALAASEALHGIEGQTLVLEYVLHLPLGMIGTTDKMTVRFRQTVRGVPVEGGLVNVLFDTRGALLSIHTTGMPRVADFPTSPALDATRAARRAAEWFRSELGLLPTAIHAPVLVIDQHDVDGQRTPRLAWKTDVQFQEEGFEPVGKHVFVDASNGAVYRTTESVHFFDISGTVSAFASPGVLPDIASNPATAQPARFIRVSSGAVVTYTDGNGAFTLPGVNAPASVTFQFANGQWANAQNAAGAEYSLTETLNAATGNVVTMNSPAVAGVTAQANCSRVVPLVRDFIKSLNPSDTKADFSVTANTAVSGTCNAYYDGGSINFYNAGGGCSNTAYSTVIAHEEGHWLNDLYFTGNGSDGMGEGNADVWAMYVFDTAIVGQNFQGTSFIRTGTNTRQFCGDANPGCHSGGVHANGEVWMGAAWKIRSRLNTALGNTQGDLVANSIFLAWMNAYNQTTIRSIIETQWLTLNDDDGNINNGTPHYTHIDLGFRDQGFPGVTLVAVTVSGVTDLPDTLDQNGPYVVNATIQANQNPPVVSANLFYRVDGGAFTSIPMANTGGNAWTTAIPGIAAPAHVEYYVRGTDSAAGVGQFPTSAPNNLVDFDIGIVHVLRFHNFDAVTDEGWTHGSFGDTSSSTDDWERGTPAGKTGTGWADPASAFSPSSIWGTDLGQGNFNGAYAANIHTYLRTPITNCTGATNVRLRFRRWLSVQGSASDQARILVNGQQIYINPTTNFNDGAWVTQELFLGPIANDNPSVQVEWRIRTNGTTNYGGWNIDDVKLLWIEAPPPPCPAPVNYCVTSPNSVGPGALMGYQGSPRISDNNFELIASGLPTNSVGIFFYGQGTTQTAFGNGFRCVSGTIYRLQIVSADFIGDARFALNYNTLPGPVAAGEVWNFQYWYRNPAGGGAGFNLSDGLSVTFCP
ncbi:MAG: hypothetical protein JNK02_11150 [Planctomycetes bacterium]|nr:hypothetical protein [Planctomycetota bacterium]